MSRGEIIHRVGEKVRKNRSRGRLEGWSSYEVGTKPIPYILGLRETVLEASLVVREAVAAAAGALVDGHFSALGVSWPKREPGNLFPNEIWCLDPMSGRSWPGKKVFCFDIAYRHERILGDVKYVWELNRLQFLQPLAAHVALTGDGHALAAIVAAIDSWFDANPPYRGIAWTSGIELGLRAVSLLLVASLCGDRLPPVTVGKIRSILSSHAAWLARFPSRFSSANNHLVVEAAGQFLIGLAMPELPFAVAMERRARETLEVEAVRQILPDGVGAEQSPTYGAFTAEMFLLSAFAARKMGRPLAESVCSRLSAFADYIHWIAEVDGTVPSIGDNDEGRVLTLSQPEPNYASSVAAAILGFLGRSAIGQMAGTVQQTAHCLYPKVVSLVPAGSKTFPIGGYTVYRGPIEGRSIVLIIDHGPLGYLSIAAHGHADALSIILSIDGKPLFVDPGTFLYHSGERWRDWFRGTRAHNTLTLGGVDQSIIAGPFNWSHKAVSCLETSEIRTDWLVIASHGGYLKRFGVRHERRVRVLDDGIEIFDRLVGTELPPLAEITFQLADGLEAKLLGENGPICITDRRGTMATLVLPNGGSITLLKGHNSYDGGWISPRFGHKVPAWRIAWQGLVNATGVTSILHLNRRW